MAKVRTHLDRTPIVEAVIDLRLRPNDEVPIETIEAFAASIEGYEVKGPIFQLETTWSIEQEVAKNRSKSQSLGIRLHSSDEKYVLQLTSIGFTLSRLEPYESWEKLIAEARRHWERYSSAIQPAAITRVATRFINRIAIPMKPAEQFEEYLTAPPMVPDELPQGVVGFTQRVVVVDPETDARANIVQSLQEGLPSPDVVPIVVDIDVYKMVEMKPNAEDAWELLDGLRVFKNSAFYASITEKTVALYE